MFTDRHIVDDFIVPFDWPRWVGLDPGIRTFGILWIAVGPDKAAYIYREMYLAKIQATAQGYNKALWMIVVDREEK